MTLEHPLRQIVRELDRAGIPHMLTGSFASTYHGDCGQFDVVLLESGWKVDLILRKERAFGREEFARLQPTEIAGTAVWIASAEDIVVAKLEWAQAGESERRLRDVIGILQVRSGELDLPYIERWVQELGLSASWQRAKAEAGEG